MILSNKSILNFFTINIPILLLAFIQLFAFDNNFLILFGFSILRNLLLLFLIDFNISNKPYINQENRILPIENYNHEFLINLTSTTLIESLTNYFIINYSSFNNINYFYDLLLFIPISFLFEVILDFFHYWSHRYIHQNKFLYRHIHKKHHHYPNPNVWVTYYQDPIDLLITNSLPTCLSLLFIPKISLFTYSSMNIYKNYLEICGHCGKDTFPTSCFPQFIWLPKFFNIELHTRDHDKHHSRNNCNYSKRFKLWDKIFNTYKN
jgi:sterol desaturase/sphingolipid hydroxylase (fatty acid hydroxylase superfamily)